MRHCIAPAQTADASRRGEHWVGRLRAEMTHTKADSGRIGFAAYQDDRTFGKRVGQVAHKIPIEPIFERTHETKQRARKVGDVWRRHRGRILGKGRDCRCGAPCGTWITREAASGTARRSSSVRIKEQTMLRSASRTASCSRRRTFAPRGPIKSIIIHVVIKRTSGSRRSRSRRYIGYEIASARGLALPRLVRQRLTAAAMGRIPSAG